MDHKNCTGPQKRLAIKGWSPSISMPLLLLASFVFQISAMTPNPIISRNKPVYGSPSANIDILVNGKYGETWSVNDGSWVAIKLDGNYSKILINWNNPAYSWSDTIASANSCKNNMTMMVDYDILKSSNSTNGTDGDWTTSLNVRHNTVTARSHAIDFSGSKWVKIAIVKGGGSLDEVEVFDISNGNDDTWFFPGTSISANSFKSNPPLKSFADLITESHPQFTPAIIRGGIPCISSTTMANDISKYLDVARNVKYWAIEMGTNDAWGGSNYFAPTYKTNMQLIIDSCKANNIQPVIARIIGTDSAKTNWQVHPDFLKAIDSLTVKNHLIPGPDLFTYFSHHVSELSDGVHPTAAGGASVFRLWAQKMDSIYGTVSVIDKKPLTLKSTYSAMIYTKANNGNAIIKVRDAGTLSIYSLRGDLIEMVHLPANGIYEFCKNRSEFCIVKFTTRISTEVLTLTDLF